MKVRSFLSVVYATNEFLCRRVVAATIQFIYAAGDYYAIFKNSNEFH